MHSLAVGRGNIVTKSCYAYKQRVRKKLQNPTQTITQTKSQSLVMVATGALWLELAALPPSRRQLRRTPQADIPCSWQSSFASQLTLPSSGVSRCPALLGRLSAACRATVSSLFVKTDVLQWLLPLKPRQKAHTQRPSAMQFAPQTPCLPETHKLQQKSQLVGISPSQLHRYCFHSWACPQGPDQHRYLRFLALALQCHKTA